MRLISVLSICVTTIFCSSKFKVDGEWSAQLANVFIDDNENAYILVDNVAYDYRGSRPGMGKLRPAGRIRPV
jgi:pyrimidine operon attenuation protein/uracil phosphoribosyltransferase